MFVDWTLVTTTLCLIIESIIITMRVERDKKKRGTKPFISFIKLFSHIFSPKVGQPGPSSLTVFLVFFHVTRDGMCASLSRERPDLHTPCRWNSFMRQR